MKMMCIKEGQWVRATDYKPADGPNPQYGDIVTVIDQRIITGLEVVILAEYYSLMGYLRKWFIPLSDIDETEMIREKELVNA